MIPMPPLPPGVAIAAMVELSIFIASASAALLVIFLWENNQFSHVALPSAFGANIRIAF